MAVDLNADVGEGFADDERLLDVVTSVNVACGFHAGSRETMRMVCALAAGRRDVAVGAHPSYRDREGFGRRALDVPPDTLRDDVAEQLSTLVEIALEEGAFVTYVKPHGALYTRAIADADVARAIVDATFDYGVAMLTWPGSELFERAHAGGMEAFAEGFADRGYANGALVPRDQSGALLAATEAAEQAVALAHAGEVRSICVHGDSPGAADTAAQVRAALVEAGFTLRRFS
ncbi:MAG TPA: 5-oxoprolinase subunit PxpA [Gaiellaceae bacterium]|nr:5-oxoprolinase subunit PxpA [Gaiellaceae bacterium]